MGHLWDVAVLGAGVAGSSVAKALSDKGWKTILIDRQRFPRHKVCGEFLSPESQRMLHALGLRETIEWLHPSLINRTRLVFNHGTPLEIPLPGTALGISRYKLDLALQHAARSSGVHVQTDTTVCSVDTNLRGYSIVTKQGTESKTYQARAVIAAWGMNPQAGLSVQRNHRSAKHTYIGVKSHYKGVEGEPLVELYFFSGGYLGISPIEDGLVNVAALLTRSAFDNEKSIMGLIEAAVRRNPKLERRLARAIPVSGTQAAVAPVDLNRKLVAWELFPHVGDAALMLPPLCGDGMSMALRSAHLCAIFADQYLHGDLSLSQWQHDYSQSIQQEFKGPLLWGRFMQWLISVPIIPRLALGIGHLSPEMAFKLVQKTRLKDSTI